MSYDVKLEDGDFPVHTDHVTGIELTAQRIRVRLGMHRGEWLLNRFKGLPFMRWRQDKPPPLRRIESRVRRTLRETPGVDEVRNVRARLNDRRVDVTGRIFAEDADEAIELEAVLVDEEGNVSPTVAMSLAESGTVL